MSLGIIRVYQAEQAYQAIADLADGRENGEELVMDELEALYDEMPYWEIWMEGRHG